MLWFVFCAVVILSPLILFLVLDRAWSRGVITRPRAERSLVPEDLNGVSAALEAQFLLAPIIAIREAEDLLRRMRGYPVQPQALDGVTLAHLRRSFEEVIGEVEHLLPAAGGSARLQHAHHPLHRQRR